MKASKKFALLHERAKTAGLRLVVMLVDDDVESAARVDYHEIGEPAGSNLGAALSKVDEFLELPPIAARAKAVAEREACVRQLNDLASQLLGSKLSLREIDDDLVRAARQFGKRPKSPIPWLSELRGPEAPAVPTTRDRVYDGDLRPPKPPRPPADREMG